MMWEMTSLRKYRKEGRKEGRKKGRNEANENEEQQINIKKKIGQGKLR